MTFQTTLIEAGFNKKAAKKLADDEYFRQNFHNSKKSSEEILERINLIAVVYDTDTDSVRDAITKFPQFASLDHERVVGGIRNVYGWSKDDIKKVVFKHPQFAGLDHERVVNGIKDTYGWSKEDIKKVVFKHPPFAGLDHERVVNGIKDTYGWSKEEVGRVVFKFPQFASYDHQRVVNGIKDAYEWSKEDIKKVVFKFPPFAGLDHERVVGGIRDVYGWSKEDIKKVVFKFPQFASLDHERVMRKLGRIGRIAGLDEDTVKEKIMKKPFLAGYSAKRYLAMIDIVMHLRTEGELNDSRAVDRCLSYVGKSPYVPGTDILRVTQALKRGNYDADPPLMVTLRNSMRKLEKKEKGHEPSFRRRLVA